MEKKLNHSEGQQKLFFLLLSQLGLDKEKGIERAKERFNAVHLADLTTAQMTEVINILNARMRKQTPALTLSRPLRFRAWNKTLSRMLYEEDFLEESYWVMDFDGHVFEIGIHGSFEVHEIDIMQSTSKRDHFGKEIFHYDIFIDRSKNKWMVDWSDKDLAWVACSFEDNAMKLLSTFSTLKVIGDIYTGVEEEKSDESK